MIKFSTEEIHLNGDVQSVSNEIVQVLNELHNLILDCKQYVGGCYAYLPKTHGEEFAIQECGRLTQQTLEDLTMIERGKNEIARETKAIFEKIAKFERKSFNFPKFSRKDKKLDDAVLACQNETKFGILTKAVAQDRKKRVSSIKMKSNDLRKVWKDQNQKLFDDELVKMTGKVDLIMENFTSKLQVSLEKGKGGK